MIKEIVLTINQIASGLKVDVESAFQFIEAMVALGHAVKKGDIYQITSTPEALYEQLNLLRSFGARA